VPILSAPSIKHLATREAVITRLPKHNLTLKVVFLTLTFILTAFLTSTSFSTSVPIAASDITAWNLYFLLY
jgi:hypothetical protein